MQQISEEKRLLETLRQRAGQGKARSENSKNSTGKRMAIALWQAMASMYGHRWSSSFGTEVDPDRIWEACLENITMEQLKAGLRACRDTGLDWPPSAPEFRKMCLGKHKNELREHSRIAEADREWLAQRRLPNPEREARSKFAARRFKAEMQEAFKHG